MKSALIRKRAWIALVSLLAVAIVELPSAAGAAAGDLDPSFGAGGKVITDFGGDDPAPAFVQQPNNKLVLGGSFGAAEGDFALARYLTNGSLDPVFDGDGRVTTDFGSCERVEGLAFRPGSLVAVGRKGCLLEGGAFALARYRLDGTLDSTFDEDGRTSTDFGGGTAGAEDVAIQPDGKIVVVGGVSVGSEADFAVARFNQDGSLDSTFGTGGHVTSDFGTTGDRAWAVSLQRDGRIVVAGVSGIFSSPNFVLARYMSDGSLDASFDGDGKVAVDFGGQSFAFDSAIQSDGKILAVGAVMPPGAEHDFAIVRLNVDGSLDTEGLDPYMDAPFGAGGKVTTDFEGEDDEATSIAIEPGGRILVAGLGTPAGTGELGDFGLARYNVDGSLDSSFGAGGKVTTRLSAGEDVPWGVAVQSDGRIVLGGSSGNSSSYDFALARYLVRTCCAAGGSPPGPAPPGPLP